MELRYANGGPAPSSNSCRTNRETAWLVVSGSLRAVREPRTVENHSPHTTPCRFNHSPLTTHFILAPCFPSRFSALQRLAPPSSATSPRWRSCGKGRLFYSSAV